MSNKDKPSPMDALKMAFNSPPPARPPEGECICKPKPDTLCPVHSKPDTADKPEGECDCVFPGGISLKGNRHEIGCPLRKPDLADAGLLELAKKASDAVENDTRTPEQQIEDGVNFVMGEPADALPTEKSPAAPVQDAEEFLRRCVIACIKEMERIVAYVRAHPDEPWESCFMAVLCPLIEARDRQWQERLARYEDKPGVCNAGHESYPFKLWDCPICTEIKVARITRLEERNKVLRDALLDLISGIGGHEHWDPKGTSGVNCETCKSQTRAREKARAALAQGAKEG